MIQTMLQAYAKRVVAWRWAILLLSVLLVGGAVSQAGKVQFSSDYRDFFSADDPGLQAYESLRSAYSRDNTVLVAFAPKNKDVFTPATLGLIEQFTSDAWRLPYTRRVDSLSNFQYTRADGDDLTVKNLVSGAKDLNPEQLAAIKRIALAEPFLVDKLVSSTGAVSGVSISFLLPQLSDEETGKAVAALRAKLAEYRSAHPDIAIHATGDLLLDYAFEEQSQNDIMTLVPLMYLCIFVVMFCVTRRVAGILGTLLVLTFSVLAAVGIAGFAGIKFSAVSVSAPTVIMTVAVSSCIHVVLAVLNGMAQGQSKHAAIAGAMGATMPILFFVSATDVLGFLSMRLSSVPPIVDFGTIVAAGTAASFLFASTFLPALLAVLPLKVRPAEARRGANFGQLAVGLIKYRRLTLAAVSALALLGSYGLMQNRYEDNFVNYFSTSVPFRVDSDFIEGNLSGVHEILYSVPAKGAGGIAELEYQNALERFTAWMRAQPEVYSVASISDVVKRVNRSMHGDDPAYYRVPDDAKELAQYLLLFELSLPAGLELNDQIRVDRSATKMSVMMRNMPTASLLAFEQRSADWLQKNAPAYMATRGTGPSILFSRIGEVNVEGMMQGYVLQLLLISLAVAVFLRSFKFGVLSLIPNVLPSILAFGAWGFFVGQIGMSVSIVAVMTYGIIVDDTIHTIFKYVHARKQLRLGADEAVEYVYAQIGPSIFSTTLTLMAGFAVLAFSHFDLNKDLGLMSVMTIGIAATCDFLIMPALFSLTGRWGRDSKYAQHPPAVRAAETRETTLISET
ncbi:efflux RND transporter permease subunit [Janthinobacterium fluminis]|uniref:MMPL family transporter n=1 Tax=Janthinobacterium fluminis TaxID=2987524 RepID=A0ABT5K4C4_9BURK|nr:MMPL family transporter [Janthinobacterium fluminis]MDC8758951.1 MMPL family transporter [Janthinobacterium fluminis]